MHKTLYAGKNFHKSAELGKARYFAGNDLINGEAFTD
jgi:hypothetical protein